jgi:hypothetical protein
MKQLHFVIFTFFICLGGQSFTQAIPEFQVSASKGTIPQIAVGIEGKFIITWADSYRMNDWPYFLVYNIYAQQYAGDGSAIGTKLKVNNIDSVTANVNELFYPSIATDNDGNFVIIWCNEQIIYAQRYASDGTALDNNVIINDFENRIHSISYYTLSMGGDGNFIVTWQSYYNIYAQRYSNDGESLGNNFIIDTADSQTYQMSPSVSSDSSGNFIISWGEFHYSTEQFYVYAQRFSKEGAPLDNEFKVNNDTTDASIYPRISADSEGNFVITWINCQNWGECELWDVYAQHYSSDGEALGDTFKVNNSEGIDLYGLHGEAYFHAVSFDQNGNFVITWESLRNENRNIRTQRYDSGGNPTGDNFLVSYSSESNQYSPSVKLKNGLIYVSWVDVLKEGGTESIWAKVLDWNDPTPSTINENNKFQIPLAYKLNQNYPNPFNPKTTIEFDLPKASDVRIEVYNITGQKIQTLLNEKKPAGSHQVEFNAEKLSSGVYFYRIEAEEFQDVKKMILLK